MKTQVLAKNMLTFRYKRWTNVFYIAGGRHGCYRAQPMDIVDYFDNQVDKGLKPEQFSSIPFLLPAVLDN